MGQEEVRALVEAAKAASQAAYAPYSRFRVGAAALDEHGRVHVGCNVENASYGLSVCAERNAVFAMVAAGGRRLVAMAVYTPTQEVTTPCGACRQVMMEFGKGARVVCACDSTDVMDLDTKDLLPFAFVLD
ncbi:MAG: cytidine deaminase [Fimbriimonadaceae bacterium]|nr:cytidine deaminase [Fimbriimonadaceae bacterium]